MAITISDTEPRVQYTATAGQVSFSVPFEFFDNADLVVIKTANNADTTLSYNSSPSTALQYSVSGAGQTGGGSISLGGSGATLNDKITIYRNLAIARSTDFPTSGAFQVESLNTELDKIIAMIQQNERDLKFSPKALATTSNTYNLTFPNLEANKVLTVNSSGDGLVFSADIGSYEGNWATATGYNLRDIVKQSSASDSTTLNNIYICNTAHTSTGTYLTQNDTANWTLLINVADAANAVVDAEAAKTAAEAAQVAAETAQTAAELAETNAETAETNAETAETNAAASASTASTQATNAANSASSASTSASNASSSASSASTSATNAANSATTAGTQATNASNYATAAATSASNAATSESNASTSASNAASSASTATTQATNASNSATSAASSATAAQAAQTAAELALDNFDDIYLGSKASDPSVDNDGDPLTAGDLYFNTTVNQLKYYDGSSWSGIGVNTDETVKVSANDTTNGYLNGKLVAGTGISFVENNDGSNETLTINSSLNYPTISSIAPDTITNNATSVVITGTNFVITPNVEIISTTGAISYPNSITRDSATQLTINVTLPTDGTYFIRVENPDGLAVRSSTALLTVSDAPTWSTAAGSLGSIAAGSSVSLSVSGSSDSTVAYSETTAVLTSNTDTPNSTMNLSLNSSTGAITGTAPSPTSEKVYNFTLRLTDAESQTTDRAFSITVTVGINNGGQFN